MVLSSHFVAPTACCHERLAGCSTNPSISRFVFLSGRLISTADHRKLTYRQLASLVFYVNYAYLFLNPGNASLRILPLPLKCHARIYIGQTTVAPLKSTVRSSYPNQGRSQLSSRQVRTTLSRKALSMTASHSTVGAAFACNGHSICWQAAAKIVQ